MIGRVANTVLREARRQLRPPRNVCPFCFEADHIGGRNHIGHLTVDVCQLHHAQLTEERLTAGAEMKNQANRIKSMEMALRSLAVTAHAIASAIDQLSEALKFCADQLKEARG